jgi:hypothetical protein
MSLADSPQERPQSKPPRQVVAVSTSLGAGSGLLIRNRSAFERAREQGIDSDHDALQRWRDEGNTVVFVLSDDQAVGAIALADIIRAESGAAIDKLKSMGLQCMMLTGDSESVARSVAAELELDDYFAEVLPEDKAKKIRDVKQRGLRAVARHTRALCRGRSRANCPLGGRLWRTGRLFLGAAPVDFQHIVAVGIGAPVPACCATMRDRMASKAFQLLPVFLANDIAW